MLNIYEFCLVCILMLQYLWLKKEEKIKVKAEKQPASLESSQIDAIGMQRKKCRSVNFNLRMQKRFKESLLEILKGHRNLQKSAPKVNRDNLKDFKSDSESLRDSLKSFEDTSEGEIKLRALSGDLNEDQLEAEWVWLRLKKAQQRLFWHIIYNYVKKRKADFEFFSFFKSVICSFQNFNL